MPHVEVGQCVLWSWNGGAKDASPATVIGVGTGTVNLAVHVNGVKDHILKQGVRHQDDPFLRRAPNHDGGVFHLTPRDQRIDAMLAAFEYKQAARVSRQPSSVLEERIEG